MDVEGSTKDAPAPPAPEIVFIRVVVEPDPHVSTAFGAVASPVLLWAAHLFSASLGANTARARYYLRNRSIGLCQPRFTYLATRQSGIACIWLLLRHSPQRQTS